FIVGFPGESAADFAATLDLVRAIGFAQAFSFKYSPRPGTPAANAADQIPEPVKAERLAFLQARLHDQQRVFNHASVRRLLPALYGERDQHLDRIERQLGVSLVPRGNRLAIAGPASATEIARLALSRLYDRLKGGNDVDTASVEAALRLAQAEIDDKSLSLW